MPPAFLARLSWIYEAIRLTGRSSVFIRSYPQIRQYCSFRARKGQAASCEAERATCRVCLPLAATCACVLDLQSDMVHISDRTAVILAFVLLKIIDNLLAWMLLQ